jgi:hypothetical protein
MARSASIRVDRLTFLAKLKAVLQEFETYEQQHKEAKDKYLAEVTEWATKIVKEGNYESIDATSYRISMSLSDEVLATKPKYNSIDVPKKHRYGSVDDLIEIISLLEMSNEVDVNTFTYRGVTQYLS